MIKTYFLLAFFFFPQISLGFSETEIDSLESTGKKTFSGKTWRTQLGLSLQRNLEINSRFATFRKVEKDLFDPNKEGSLLDFSNLYYSINLNLNYSLQPITKKFNYEWLENAEIFLSTSFATPFTGYNNNLKDYNSIDYFQYALGDLIGGFTAPAYKYGKLLSYVSVSFIMLPLSKFSKEAGLVTTTQADVSFLYFLKKKDKWNLSLSSSHSLAYSYYTKDSAGKLGKKYNIPYDTSQIGGLIYRQSYNKYLPANIKFLITHFFGINTNKTQNHDLTIGFSSSWKVKEQFYLNSSIRWRDRIYIYNPYNKAIKKKQDIQWFNWNRSSFSFGGSYSF